jgi:hypothetical protein
MQTNKPCCQAAIEAAAKVADEYHQAAIAQTIRALRTPPTTPVEASTEQPSKADVERAEDWQSINQWCDDTFGKATVPQIIARAKEEFEELEAEGCDSAIEAADVVICLCRIPGFADALQRKMAINRKRKWRLVGNGTGYHIPDAALRLTEPPASEGDA